MDVSVIAEALSTVTHDIFHYEKIGTPDKYIVWAEEAQSDAMWADDEMQDQAIGGTADYFTRIKNDPNVALIQAALNGVCSWALNSVQYETNTGFVHYEFTWEVLDGENDV